MGANEERLQHLLPSVQQAGGAFVLCLSSSRSEPAGMGLDLGRKEQTWVLSGGFSLCSLCLLIPCAAGSPSGGFPLPKHLGLGRMSPAHTECTRVNHRVGVPSAPQLPRGGGGGEAASPWALCGWDTGTLVGEQENQGNSLCALTAME